MVWWVVKVVVMVMGSLKKGSVEVGRGFGGSEKKVNSAKCGTCTGLYCTLHTAHFFFRLSVIIEEIFVCA